MTTLDLDTHISRSKEITYKYYCRFTFLESGIWHRKIFFLLYSMGSENSSQCWKCIKVWYSALPFGISLQKHWDNLFDFLKLKRRISSETVRRTALPKIPTFHPDPKQIEMVMRVSWCKALNCSSSHLKGDSASLSSRLCAFPPGNIPRLKQRQPDSDSSPHSHAEKRFRVNKHWIWHRWTEPKCHRAT